MGCSAEENGYVHGKLRNCEEKGLSRHEIVKAQKRREKAEKEQQEQSVTQEPWTEKGQCLVCNLRRSCKKVYKEIVNCSRC